MLVLLGSAGSARADYMFNFNSLAAFTGSSGNNDTAIADYMDGVLGGSCATHLNCVTVTGAVTNQSYNGENHVVGPNGVSLTLGDSNGATSNSSKTPGAADTFISTIEDGTSRQISTEITITFSQGIVLNGPISFDYEIFPDNGCQSKSNCPTTPDFKFAVNGGTPTLLADGVFPSATGTDGSSTKSPLGTELSSQYIGVYSRTLTNVTELQFIDWPAAIGVDNLDVSTSTPEPRGVALLLGGLMLALFAGNKLRNTLAKSSN